MRPGTGLYPRWISLEPLNYNQLTRPNLETLAIISSVSNLAASQKPNVIKSALTRPNFSDCLGIAHLQGTVYLYIMCSIVSNPSYRDPGAISRVSNPSYRGPEIFPESLTLAIETLEISSGSLA